MDAGCGSKNIEGITNEEVQVTVAMIEAGKPAFITSSSFRLSTLSMVT